MASCKGNVPRRFFTVLHDYWSCGRSNIHGINISRHPTLHNRAPYHASRALSAKVSNSQEESLRPQNHYQIFPNTLAAGPPPNGPFAINVRQLRNEFLRLQSKAHPDMHSGAAKARAAGLSSLINEAYKTLQNPLLRAQYLLSLRGMDVADDETAKVEDPELLMEVLEMRETIEATEEEAELEPLKRTNDERIQHSVSVLDEAFRRDDIEAAKNEAIRLRYWVNIKESLDGWERGKPVVLVH